MHDGLNTTMADARDAADAQDSACDAWLRAIALLQPQRHTPTPWSAEENAPGTHAPIITIVERPNAGLAVVSWRDATHCRYGARVWTIGTARDAGVCALSGRPIGKGHLVFRPQRARPTPLNANAMILAAAIDETRGINVQGADDELPTFRYRSNTR